jgi:hypothetical protein
MLRMPDVLDLPMGKDVLAADVHEVLGSLKVNSDSHGVER